MAMTFPLDLPSLADKLSIASVKWDVMRFDQYSGIGSGHDLQAELAAPKWIADIELSPGYSDGLKQIAAITRKLHGSQNAFMLFDPLSQFPQADPDGSVLAASTVQVYTVGTDRQSLRLKGLPAGYVLTISDKAQIVYSSDPTRNFFLEISETVTASGAGITPSFEIYPHIPVGIAIDDVVILKKPACKMIMLPGSSNPGTARNIITEGASFRAIEKK